VHSSSFFIMSFPISATAIVSDAPNGAHVSWRKAKVQLREIGEDELLVKIIASGVCHTDIAISSFPVDTPGFHPYPKILGHEGAGIVEQVGNKISHVKKGDKVLLSFDYCGNDDCRACEDETPGYCEQFHVKNLFHVPDVYQIDGKSAGGLYFGQSSFSSLALVKGTSIVNVEQLVKDEEELKLFAPMGCGYQTGAGAVTELANVGKKDVVVVGSDANWKLLSWLTRVRQVFGLGGVGMSAIMVRLDARQFGLSGRPRKLV
jgi:Zn-dependent alcohol dehydrogenase